MRPSIRNHPDFDYGALGSLRQFISSSNYRPFQNLNHEMYLKIAERHLLESMVEFLATKQINTTDVEKRMAVILNDDVRRAKGRSQLLNALEPPL